MPRAAYTLELELEYNTWTDVTADWHTPTPLIVERGAEPGERVAGVGRMAFALYNPDGRYTPGHANATPGFEAGIGVRLQASDGESMCPLFTGRLAALNAAPGKTPTHVAPVCEDEMAALARVPVGAFPLLLDAQPGDLAERLVTRSFVPPGRLACWRLAHPQASLLGESTALSSPDTGVNIAAGQSRFAWAGDTWPPALPALAALREVCASEGGFFFIAADGTPTFHDRHTRPRRIAPDAELAGGLAGLAAERGLAQAANWVEVTVYPREVAQAAAVLWEAGHSLRVDPGRPRVLSCPYRDPDERIAQVGALSLVTPVVGTDYTVTDQRDGAGKDLATHVAVRVEAGGTAARVTLENTWPPGRQVYVHGLRLRGVPLRRAYPAISVASDADSQFALGLHPLRLDMPLQDDAGVGADMAHALLANRRSPRVWVAVTLEATASAVRLAQALARDVGDRLRVSDAGLGPEPVECFIEAVRHEITRGGASHRVTWRTSPADLEAYWALGETPYATMGAGSRLGY